MLDKVVLKLCASRVMLAGDYFLFRFAGCPRSFAKKEEVERIIASEIAQLSRKLQQERDIEISREVRPPLGHCDADVDAVC